MNLQDSFQRLMADTRLVELCELHRTGDSIFDVIDLGETQHSQMFAWMLDPKEGHGQGDEIVRDLLTSASMDYRRRRSVGRDTPTGRFFRKWTPAALRTASFASAFTATELHITKTERLDLVVVDTQNRFVVVIENKAGTRHKRTQLDRYTTRMAKALTANGRLRNYDTAFIAIDSRRNPDAEGAQEADDTWVHLGYDWLKTSAGRAQSHLERGNASAKLVATYCQTMTESELPREKKTQKLAAALHRDYPEAIRKLVTFESTRAEMSWLTSEERDRTWMVFGLQNKSVIDTFVETAGMNSVGIEIRDALGLPEENVESSTEKLSICPRNAEGLGKGHWWPVFIRVTYSSESRDRFRVEMLWRGPEAVSIATGKAIRAALVGINKGFADYPDARRRWVRVEDDVTLAALKRAIAVHEASLSTALSAVRR
jgi:hypothetical protein